MDRVSRAVFFVGLGATTASAVPTALMGAWSGNITTSVLGPQQGAMATINSVVVSSAGADGSIYIRQLGGLQLFRVQGGLMQYCFMYDVPARAEEAPFAVAESDDPNELKLCWRGPRLPSHSENCSGCSCAQWSLKVSGDTLQSTMLMSPPVVHLSMGLVRSGPPPTAEEVRANWNCRFDNYSGPPVDPMPPPPVQCPLRRLHQPKAVSQHLGQLKQCGRFNDRVDARLEYEASKLPCMPCDVAFSFSMDTSSSNYIAMGFKQHTAAYMNASVLKRELPNYWGMATDVNTTELSSRIFVAHVGANGQPCFRHFHAGAYVGVLNPAPDDGTIRNTAVSHISGRTQLTFTVSMHLGSTADEISWSGAGFGSQQFMWASGPLGSGSGREAQVFYHQGERALAPMNFLTYGQHVECQQPSATPPSDDVTLVV